MFTQPATVIALPRRPSVDQPPALYSLGQRLYRILQLMVLAALVFGLIYGWRWLSDPQEFPIRKVKVQADYQHVDQQTLQAQVMPYLQKGFVRLDGRGLKQTLSTNPWIAEVDVQRVWPDSIVIRVTEQQAVARWNDGALLNSKGESFAPPPDTFPVDLPALHGSDDQMTLLWQQYQATNDALAPLNLKVTRLEMNAHQAMTVTLDNGMQLLLGSTEPLPRLQRFVKVYPKIFTSAEAQADYVDLRYANGVSVKWRNTATKTTNNPPQSE